MSIFEVYFPAILFMIIQGKNNANIYQMPMNRFKK